MCFGMNYFEPRLACDTTQVERFRHAVGKAGVSKLLVRTVNAAVKLNAIKTAELETIIVDTTVQARAIVQDAADSRLLDLARLLTIIYSFLSSYIFCIAMHQELFCQIKVICLL
jgi:hypothetical protein